MILNINYPVINLSTHHKNWIIEAIFRESAEAFSKNIRWNYFVTIKKSYLSNPKYIYNRFSIKNGTVNVFSHHTVFIENVKIAQRLRKPRIYFTHFDEIPKWSKDLIERFNSSDRFFVQNSEMKEILKNLGLIEEKIFFAPGAIDRLKFYPAKVFSEINREYVLVSAHLKPRKNPLLIYQVIKEMRDTFFIIHGKEWDLFPKDISKLKNVRCIDFQFEKQPKLMRNATVYLSLSKVEGGPIPLMEALASGTPVVSTNTGFASDLINSDRGIVLEKMPSLDEVIQAIERAKILKEKVFNKDLLNGQFTWNDLGEVFYGN